MLALGYGDSCDSHMARGGLVPLSLQVGCRTLDFRISESELLKCCGVGFSASGWALRLVEIDVPTRAKNKMVVSRELLRIVCTVLTGYCSLKSRPFGFPCWLAEG